MLKITTFLFLVVYVHARKETLTDLDKLLNDPNIWKYIEKRVGPQADVARDNPAHVEDSESLPENNKPHKFQPDLNTHYKAKSSGLKTLIDTSGNSCSYQQNTSFIIRSKASMDNGAYFLKNAFDLSNEECAMKCCYTQNCNLAVYEDKEQHSCYLFDCGSPSKCLFAHHGNYSIMSFQIHDYLPQKHQKYHEDQLESLGKTPTPLPTTTRIKTTPTPSPVRVKVPLYGDCHRVWGEKCGDRNAECLHGQCKCKEGYHGIYGVCREECSDDEFQCRNKGQGDNVPECIDNKNRCDGTPQCADGSDEEKCPTEENNHSEKARTGSQGIVSPSIPSRVESQSVQKPIVNNQLNTNPNLPVSQNFGKTSDKTGFVNPNVYGNNNPLIPPQLQDYYWSQQQQGLLNNPQYQSPYSDYPQFQSHQIGQGYLNNLGYGGQKYPYNAALKNDNSDLSSNLFGVYPPKQNIPSNPYQPNPAFNKNGDINPDNLLQSYNNFKYPYQNPSGTDLSHNEKLDKNKNLTRIWLTTTPSPSTTTTKSTTTTVTTTTTTTTTTKPMPITTKPDDRYLPDNYIKNWPDGRHYFHGKQHQDMQESLNRDSQNVDELERQNYNFNQGSHKSDDFDRQNYNLNDNSHKSDDFERQNYNLDDNSRKSDERQNYNSNDNSRKSESSNSQSYKDSSSSNKHYKNSKGDYKNSKGDYSGDDSYRYPYRFRQKGKYADYGDGMKYNWQEYYDDRPDYPDFHHQYPRPGKKMDYYDNIFKGGDNKEPVEENEEHLNNHGTNTPKPEEPPVKEDNSDLDNEYEEKPEISEEKNTNVEETEQVEKDPIDNDNIKTTTTTVTTTKTLHKTTLKSLKHEGPEKVIIKSPTDSSQGPIVALALGLGICLMLLIFVGCRLRTVKRKIRRGKSLHSNEADYLINGMYL